MAISYHYKHFLACRHFFVLFNVLLFQSRSNDVSAQECDANGLCDTHERCPVWKEEGECSRNRSYMQEYCPVSCKDWEKELNELKKKLVKENGGDECIDFLPLCPVWESLGDCVDNKAAIGKLCPKSCDACPNKSLDRAKICTDDHASCGFWAERGECEKNPNYMLKSCRKSCGECETEIVAEAPKQRSLGEDLLDWSESVGVRQEAVGASAGKTLEVIEQSKDYFNTDDVKNLPSTTLGNCKNQHGMCSFWASMGECKNNKAYMTTNCAPSCRTCALLDIAARCPPRENAKPALRAGDLNKMFERIVATAPGNRTLTEEERMQLVESKTPAYSVVVKSRPSELSSKEVSAIQDKSSPPWVLVFENFLTDEECDQIIQLGYQFEYKRSEDVGKKKFDGTHDSVQSKGRTSENAWCKYPGCRNLEIPARIHTRIETMLQIPANNSEDFQILKYEKDQFYHTHHDYIPHHVDRNCGPRILTFFMYISDVESGGGTNFPQLDITVEPKKGRALLWPSVFNSDPMSKDGRFMHQALPVEAGVKYAVNGWIHMYDYVTTALEGCT